MVAGMQEREQRGEKVMNERAASEAVLLKEIFFQCLVKGLM